MTSVFIFISGAALLILSAEKLIDYLVGIALGLRISLFLIAVVFTGIEFDDVVLGVALNVEKLESVALGVVFGTALSMTGVVLALAAILTPTVVRVPRNYLVIFAGAPLVMVPFTLMAPLTRMYGLLLLGLFGVFLGYVVVQESKARTPVFRDAELYEEFPAVRRPGGDTTAVREVGATGGIGPTATGRVTGLGVAESVPLPTGGRRSGWSRLGLAVLALAGLIVGAATTGIGTDGILHTYNLEGTVFGATIVTAVLTAEDIFLTVEPIRRGVPEIGVGNVIGSVVFCVTGKLGIILLTGQIVVTADVLSWHLPALIVVTGLAAYFMSTGRLRRWHGYVLLALYIAYWIVSFSRFGGPPIDVS